MSSKAHCCHILVKTLTEANNVKARLDKGEKFAEIAKQVSLCSSGKKEETSEPSHEAKW